MKLKKIEIELSSHCNAKCPGCLRTQIPGEFTMQYLDFDQCKAFFKDLELFGVEIKLCGVLGDPLLHPRLLEVCEWFIAHGALVTISTNAGIGSSHLWESLGELSKETNKLFVTFSVDGLSQTNHLYRIGVDFQKVRENMISYTRVGGKGNWFYIEFHHNSEEREDAKRMATELGLNFFIRRATRNFEATWNKEKSSDSKLETKPHSQIEDFNKIKREETQYNPESISCKFVHEGECFIASDGTLWPCCFLWDELFKKNQKFKSALESLDLPDNWNHLSHHSFLEIIEGPFYRQLQNLWKIESDLFTKRCFSSCAKKGKLRNEIIPA